MPILLLGTLAALPWLATLGLRLSVIFNPPAQVDRSPRRPNSRRKEIASSSKTTSLSPARRRLNLDASTDLSVKSRSSGQEPAVSTVSAVSVAATAAQTEDETEQVDSFIQMQRAKGTFGTLRTAEQSSAITSPISSAKDRRRSERTSALLASSMSPTPNGALLSGDGRRPSTYCQTPPLGQSNSGQLLPPQLAGALSRKLHRNTTQPHDPMVEQYMLLRRGVNEPMDYRAAASGGVPGNGGGAGVAAAGAGRQVGFDLSPMGSAGGGGLYGNKSEIEAHDAIWGTEHHDIFWGWEGGVGRNPPRTRRESGRTSGEGQEGATARHDSDMADGGHTTPVMRGWPDVQPAQRVIG